MTLEATSDITSERFLASAAADVWQVPALKSAKLPWGRFFVTPKRQTRGKR
jgi:hypothetical protein